MKKALFGLSLLVLSNTVFSNYCAGVRGNGELAISHWSALSKVVENKGMPEKMAGGSSASVTMLFMDGISRNHLVSINDELKRKQQALMLKTIAPHFLYLFKEEGKAPTVMRILGNISGIKKSGFLDKVKTASEIAKNSTDFIKIVGEYGPVLNPELVKGLTKDFAFYKQQAKEAADVFGNFDAEGDKNIFYRKGLVDFKYLGVLFGRVADFYAGHGSAKTNEKLEDFLNSCAEISYGNTWYDIEEDNPECFEKLNSALDSYYDRENPKRNFPNKMIYEKVGSGLKAFPTTSAIVGDSVSRFKQSLAKFEDSKATDVDNFTIDFDSELEFVYWGNRLELDSIKANLEQNYPHDIKANKMMPMYDGRWFEVMGTSPAEPGLAALQLFPDSTRITPGEKTIPYREGIISAGGWSDLHPSVFLRASGCDDVMYVTRQDGPTKFGQQIFIRLAGETEIVDFWTSIGGQENRDGYKNLGPEQQETAWNKLFNLGNPDSSFNLALKESDSVYCTDWNKFNVFKNEIKEAILDAWEAPIFVRNPLRIEEFSFGGNPMQKSSDGFPGCIYKANSLNSFANLLN